MLKYNIKFNIYVKTYMLYAIAFEINRGIFNKTWRDCVVLLNQKPPDFIWSEWQLQMAAKSEFSYA